MPSNRNRERQIQADLRRALHLRGVSVSGAGIRQHLTRERFSKAGVIMGRKHDPLVFLPKDDAEKLFDRELSKNEAVGWSEFLTAQQLLREALERRDELPIRHQAFGVVGYVMYAEHLLGVLRTRAEKRRQRRFDRGNVVVRANFRRRRAVA